MADSCPPLPALHLDNTLGAAYIGNVLAAILYGFTSIQVYIFFERYNDGRMLRSLVMFLWVLDTVHIALICHTIYFYAVTNFANPLAMLYVTKTIMAHVMITGVSDVTIRGSVLCVVVAEQSLNSIAGSSRIEYVSQGKQLLVPAILLPSLVCFACSIEFPIRGLRIGTYAGFSRISWVLYTAFGTGVVADVTIAAALCYFLTKRRTGFRRTDSIVQLMIVYSINTGLLTSLCAICVLVAYATMPANFVFIAFYFVLPKLFMNSLLGTLNAREKLRGFGSGGAVSIPLNAVVSPNRASVQPVSGVSDTRLLEIQIQTAVDSRTDSTHSTTEKKWRGPYR
ncbi:uncharacterized protein PHACADRAFT_198638 [Phanerochaete carnosa HHB-10118-sp]|uniref:DUF6534 domain-containing protein n=1 Tax=Phanerochaete carnosa (strain HHB-10118-sp) TaxID=650164 RepID=K5VMA5_PHACS|nr:uncharacterized protein PHACADRAFT_198638 [Phanerochaete carnosa HHB-10118-sp]EKM52588.1 hypothetical protein PHACADRAFT_198638 [Phanerochaete carnosa HHB-10118-sp]